jgi:hypothetical protein
VAAKRLYAFFQTAILVTLILYSSCSKHDKTVTGGLDYPIQKDTLDIQDNTPEDKYFFALEHINELMSEKNQLDSMPRVITKQGKLFISLFDDNVYNYDSVLHRFKGIYYAEGLKAIFKFKGFNSPRVKSYLYIVGDTLIRYTDNMGLVPNTDVAIYAHNNMFFSVHETDIPQKFEIIRSEDLVTWIPTGIEQIAPIILYDWEGRVLAVLVSPIEENTSPEGAVFPKSEIVDISDADTITIFRKLPDLIFEPGYIGQGMIIDREITAAYQMDDTLFVRTIRAFEDGWFKCEHNLNLNNFGYRSKTIHDEGDIYFEVPIKRDDGWKLYQFRRSATTVIDPYEPGERKVVEILEPLKDIYGNSVETGGEPAGEAGTTPFSGQ